MPTTVDESRTASADGHPGTAALLGQSGDGRPLPRLRRRYTPVVLSSGIAWGWVGPLLVTIFAGLLHFWGVTTPHNITFDETYYAKDAYSLLVKGHAVEFVNDPKTEKKNEADEIINSGSTEGIFGDRPSMVVHPEVGKWMIAVGEWIFGLTPLGWRFSAALTGTLMVLVMCRLVRRLTGSTLLGCVAGLLLTLDGLHFVMSRIALLDIFLAFWLLCAAHCLVADRDWARARLARRYETSPVRDRGFGPVRGLLFRPWRVAAGVCFGLAAGSKWNAVFVLAALGLLSWLWDIGMRRGLGVRWPTVKSAVVDGVPAFLSVVGVALIVYVASWAGFLTHAQEYEDAFGHAAVDENGVKADPNDWTWSSVDDDTGGPLGGIRHDLNILWNYHVEVYKFHTGDYIKEATHPFESDPAGWLLINRPLGIDVHSGDRTEVPDCPAGEQCVKQILAIGTPVLWWGGVAALVVGLGYWLARRDWRFGLPIVGVLASWLPWLRYDDRPIFYFYAVTIIPFTVVAVALVLGKILGPARASYRRRLVGTVAVSVFVLAVAVNFAYFYPILSDGLLSNENWNDRMWLRYWI